MQSFTIEKYHSQGSEIQWDELLLGVLKSFDCTTGTIHQLNKHDNLLHLYSSQGIPEHILPAVQKIPIGKGIAGAAAEKREPIEICNLQQDDGGVAKPAAKDTKVSGSVAVPIESSTGELLGTIGIGKFEPYTFTIEEKDKLIEIANQIAQIL